MSFWDRYEAPPNIVAMGDQFEKMGSEFLDALLADVKRAKTEEGEYPPPSLLAIEIWQSMQAAEYVVFAVVFALTEGMVRLAKLEDPDEPESDISGLDFGVEEEGKADGGS